MDPHNARFVEHAEPPKATGGLLARLKRPTPLATDEEALEEAASRAVRRHLEGRDGAGAAHRVASSPSAARAAARPLARAGSGALRKVGESRKGNTEKGDEDEVVVEVLAPAAPRAAAAAPLSPPPGQPPGYTRRRRPAGEAPGAVPVSPAGSPTQGPASGHAVEAAELVVGKRGEGTKEVVQVMASPPPQPAGARAAPQLPLQSSRARPAHPAAEAGSSPTSRRPRPGDGAAQPASRTAARVVEHKPGKAGGEATIRVKPAPPVLPAWGTPPATHDADVQLPRPEAAAGSPETPSSPGDVGSPGWRVSSASPGFAPTGVPSSPTSSTPQAVPSTKRPRPVGEKPYYRSPG